MDVVSGDNEGLWGRLFHPNTTGQKSWKLCLKAYGERWGEATQLSFESIAG